jgi:hypothetical protein
MLPAAALALVYLIARPPSPDLAAQVFRADLFADHGFLIWNNYWYGGHYLPGYSVLFPPLAALLGPRLVGALSAVAAAGLFGALARRRYGDRARLGTLWFGAATASLLLAGELTFALGVAIGLGALVAIQRRRIALGAGLAVLTSCASPVAGLFAILAGAALTLAGARREGIALAAGSGAALAVLTAAFPTGGWFPFAVSAFIAVPLFVVAALAVVPSDERALRFGLVLFGLLGIAAFVIHTPLGANAARLGSLFGGPVLALALLGRRPVALALLALPLLYWQWGAPIRDVAAAAGDPSLHGSYYGPLLAELDRRTGGEPVRIEIPITRSRGEAQYAAPHYALARGWLRQLEADDIDSFTNGKLTAAAYRAWLDERGVAYVALSDAETDYLSSDEAALIRRGLPYLREVWSNEHWRLFAVRGSPGLVSGAASLSAVGPDWFSLDARRPGPVLARLHFTSFWTITAGDACVAPQGDWTRVDVARPGVVTVTAPFSLSGLFGRDRECSG